MRRGFARRGIRWSLLFLSVLWACSPYAGQGRSPSQLVVVSLLTARGNGNVPVVFTNGPLLSDVRDGTAGGSVFDDFGQVTLRAILRDPGATGMPTTPTALNDVTVTQYRVQYRGTPGVSVPRGFDGAVTFTVPVGASATGVFELVRHVAKLERPLAALAGAREVLTVIADVTFFGRDQVGNALAVTASVQINFADFE